MTVTVPVELFAVISAVATVAGSYAVMRWRVVAMERKAGDAEKVSNDNDRRVGLLEERLCHLKESIDEFKKSVDNFKKDISIRFDRFEDLLLNHGCGSCKGEKGK
jgi:uncharacterized protein YeeX (DUF496 family)